MLHQIKLIHREHKNTRTGQHALTMKQKTVSNHRTEVGRAGPTNQCQLHYQVILIALLKSIVLCEYQTARGEAETPAAAVSLVHTAG